MDKIEKNKSDLAELMTAEDLANLRADIGYRYAQQVIDKCIKMYDKRYTTAYIRKSLSKPFAKHHIIEAALVVKAEKEKRVNSLINK